MHERVDYKKSMWKICLVKSELSTVFVYYAFYSVFAFTPFIFKIAFTNVKVTVTFLPSRLLFVTNALHGWH